MIRGDFNLDMNYSEFIWVIIDIVILDWYEWLHRKFLMLLEHFIGKKYACGSFVSVWLLLTHKCRMQLFSLSYWCWFEWTKIQEKHFCMTWILLVLNLRIYFQNLKYFPRNIFGLILQKQKAKQLHVTIAMYNVPVHLVNSKPYAARSNCW